MNLFTTYQRDKALNNIYNMCGVDNKAKKIKAYIINKMKPEKWYKVEKQNIEIIKLLIPDLIKKGIELTFSNDYSKIRINKW